MHCSDYDGPPPMLTSSGKRRGRKPGANSTHAQRSAANARERSRMRVLSRGFVDLKMVLPWVPRDTKLSKLDTLKLASAYIAYLKKILEEEPENKCISSMHHPLAYTWPYAFGKTTARPAVDERNQYENVPSLSPSTNSTIDREECQRYAAASIPMTVPVKNEHSVIPSSYYR